MVNVENRVDNSVYNYLLYIYTKYIHISNESLDAVIERLSVYETLLKNWSWRMNLVSSGDVDNLWKKHFIPSLKPLELGLIGSKDVCLDAGSGAGFPGIPIKVFSPGITIHFCEAKRKKALFLNRAVDVLALENVKVLNTRVEDIEGEYDVVMSRAMGKPEDVLPRLLKFVKPGGKVLLWTAISIQINSSDSEVEEFNIEGGGKLIQIIPMF